jgi:hypothetical protein
MMLRGMDRETKRTKSLSRRGSRSHASCRFRRTSRCTRRGRHHSFSRHEVSAAGPAAELGRSAVGTSRLPTAAAYPGSDSACDHFPGATAPVGRCRSEPTVRQGQPGRLARRLQTREQFLRRAEDDVETEPRRRAAGDQSLGAWMPLPECVPDCLMLGALLRCP